jgi:hypothetical protein
MRVRFCGKVRLVLQSDYLSPTTLTQKGTKGIEPKLMEENDCPKIIRFSLKMHKWCLVFRHMRCCAACYFLY